MEWLQESSMIVCEHGDEVDEVITTLILKAMDGDSLIIEATMMKNKCVISKMKYQQQEL